ncbi:hypothetical protein JKP88DRAFT_244133 [Tribonema minus]|uniref:Uncharacterized protein n=1 Tax=Tribonema minus TaxID=303371 RepID=A0A836CGU8_9STRA|nr:hypothetical protein JKP88DRAFT_244133 [Tribonema minus]
MRHTIAAISWGCWLLLLLNTASASRHIPLEALGTEEVGNRVSRELEPMEGSSAMANLCLNYSTDCFKDATCRQCILLGSITSDAKGPSKCADAKGTFKNSYNGSTSASRNLKCQPYNENTALGAYLECVWKSGPCGATSGAAALSAGALALVGGLLGIWLI